MGWSFFILSAASAAAGVALGRAISRRVRGFMLIGGIEAAVLSGGLIWLRNHGAELALEPAMVQGLALVLLGTAAVLVPFWLGSAWSGH